MAQQPLIDIKVNKVMGYLNAISDKKIAAEALIAGFQAGTLVLKIFITENLSGRKIGVITGALRRSAFVDQPRVASGGKVFITFGSAGVPYAAIHELGGAGVGRPQFRERRMFRDAAGRAMPGIIQQVALQAIKRLKEAG